MRRASEEPAPHHVAAETQEHRPFDQVDGDIVAAAQHGVTQHVTMRVSELTERRAPLDVTEELAAHRRILLGHHHLRGDARIEAALVEGRAAGQCQEQQTRKPREGHAHRLTGTTRPAVGPKSSRVDGGPWRGPSSSLIAAASASCFSQTVNLDDQLAALPPSLRDRLAARGFDPAQLEAWAATIGKNRDQRNRLPGKVEPPYPGDIADAPIEGTAAHEEHRARGQAAITRGEVALCLLAGGMATRMGGIVKALANALPGRSFLDLRLAENAHVSRAAGKRLPLWMMTSEATEGPIRAALGEQLDAAHLTTFEQFVSLRLTPEGALFHDEHGHPSVYSTGHGDLPDALRQSGLLQRFVARGGKTVWIANIDNLGATVDPAVLGFHLARGAQVSVEVVDKVGTDRGGCPVRWNGRPLITEEFRLPVGFDPASVPVFNTNTFLVSAEALAALSMSWTYVEVEKKIGDLRAVQFERILGELTAGLEPSFVRVPRSGMRSRFLPVKDVAELEKRHSEIEVIARARGMIPAEQIP
jgi:UTP--glucose-1-phosphate uridylyltransferase